MHIYLNLAMFILVIIHLKAILIKTIQTTFRLFNQLCIIASKHKSILSKSILSDQLYQNQLYPKPNQIHTTYNIISLKNKKYTAS